MIRVALPCLLFFHAAAHAQTSGTMQIELEVLPRVLTVSVRSNRLDFAQQRADAGTIILDPATGLASRKTGGAHAMGEVTVLGPAQAGFLVNIDHATALRQAGGGHSVRFTPSWAQSTGCHHHAFLLTSARQGATGMLGEDGCAMLRFGGSIHLMGAAEGRYAGQLSVRIAPL